jgi:hypothetical protein
MNSMKMAERFIEIVKSITEEDMKKNSIKSIKLITEKSMSPRLIIEYDEKMQKTYIDGMKEAEEFIKKLKS